MHWLPEFYGDMYFWVTLSEEIIPQTSQILRACFSSIMLEKDQSYHTQALSMLLRWKSVSSHENFGICLWIFLTNNAFPQKDVLRLRLHYAVAKKWRQNLTVFTLIRLNFTTVFRVFTHNVSCCQNSLVVCEKWRRFLFAHYYMFISLDISHEKHRPLIITRESAIKSFPKHKMIAIFKFQLCATTRYKLKRTGI